MFFFLLSRNLNFSLADGDNLVDAYRNLVRLSCKSILKCNQFFIYLASYQTWLSLINISSLVCVAKYVQNYYCIINQSLPVALWSHCVKFRNDENGARQFGAIPSASTVDNQTLFYILKCLPLKFAFACSYYNCYYYNYYCCDYY